MPKDNDTELSKIQASVLGTVRPLSTAWRHLVEGGVEQDPEMVVQASEVMSMIQCTLCLLGNSVELISESRRGKILEAIDPSWVKYKEFQKSLTKKVEDDSALAQAASMTKRRKEKERTTLGPKKDGRKSSNFFEGALLPSTEAGRARASSRTTHRSGTTMPTDQGSSRITKGKDQSLSFTNQDSHQGKTRESHRESLRAPMLVKELGLEMDMTIVQRMANKPVGGRLRFFVGNWEKITGDPWVRETVTGARVEFHSTPVQGKVQERCI